MKKHEPIGQPDCPYCGGLHFGTPVGECVYQCKRCKKDTRDDATGYGHQKCECAPLPILEKPVIAPCYSVSIGSLPKFRLTQVQWDDLRNAMAEYEHNGFRDGWYSAGNVRIVEIAAY